MSILHSLGLESARNYSFFAIPLAFAIANAPKFYAIYLYDTHSKIGSPTYDYANPKGNLKSVNDRGLPPDMEGRYLRAEAAQDNGFISLPFFASAVVAGNLARIPHGWLNLAVGGYLGLRVAYNFIYVFNTNNETAKWRTRVYTWSTLICFGLFISSGVKLIDGHPSVLG